ncbi:MAG TPA: hypothetical protein VHC72_20575 [Bryobacteraceae bacterium]|nr:hypothetical protein [Bryobacteraceae bacterium]
MMPVAITSPGIYSQDGSGHGRGYILHQDGTLNSPSNPARPSDKVTIFATGVGPMTFTECCAATDTPGGRLYRQFLLPRRCGCRGAVGGFPGSVYRISVYVPDPAVLWRELANAVPPANESHSGT